MDSHVDPADGDSFHLSAARRFLGSNPEARYQRATSFRSGEALDLDGLRLALGSEVKISERVLHQLFKELDVNGDGKITKKEFLDGLRARPSVEGLKAAMSLLHSFGIVETLAKHYTELLQQRLGLAQDVEVELPTFLEHVSPGDLKTALEAAQDEIVERGARKLEALRENRQCASQAKAFSDKFAFKTTTFEGTYKGMSEFLAGVEGALGLPGHDIQAGIAMEFCNSEDSKEEFETTNYGGMQTTPEQEYLFVTNPSGAVLSKQSGRVAAPLRTFLLAACAHAANSDERYDTPLEELQERERSAVLSVLLRRAVEAGFSAAVLTAASDTDPALRRLASLSAEQLDTLKGAARHALRSAAVEEESGQPDFQTVVQEMERGGGRIAPDELEALLRHMRETLKEASLSEEEIVALRLYTGPAYMKLNSTLRDIECGRRGNRYVSTIFATISGMVKLAGVSPIPPSRIVYRGQSGMRLPQCFWQGNAQGVKGGVEMAFVSTTTDLRVAIDYAGASGSGVLPTVFAIQVGAVDNGAAVGFLSQYPDEEEILLPPRSFLEVVDEPSLMPTEHGPVLSIPVSVNCNLLSPTLEKIRDQRKAMLVAALEHTRKEIVRDLEAVKQSQQLRTRAELDIFWKKLDEEDGEAYSDKFFDSIRKESAESLSELKARTPSWFRNDANFKWAMKEVLEQKRIALGKLKLWMEAKNLYVPYLSKMSGLDCDRKAVGRLVRLLEEAKARTAASPSSEEDRTRVGELALQLCRHGQLVGGDLEERHGRAAETALMREAARGNVSAVSLMLLARADANAARSDGRTPLMLAAQCGQTATSRELIRNGNANPNESDDLGRSCIFYAAGNGHTKTARALLECGANPLARSNAAWTAVHAAAYDGYLDTIQLFVKEGGVDVHAVDVHGWTAALYAAQNGHKDVVAWLIGEAGGDVEAAESKGRTAVMIAAQNGHCEVLEWLVREGKADVNAVADKGWTAVKAARRTGHGKVVEWLLTQGGAKDGPVSPVSREAQRTMSVSLRSPSDGAKVSAPYHTSEEDEAACAQGDEVEDESLFHNNNMATLVLPLAADFVRDDLESSK